MRTAPEIREGAALILPDGRRRIHLVRRPPGVPMAGLWELPGLSGLETGAHPPHPSTLRAAASAQLGRPVRLGSHLARIQHAVMNLRIAISVREARFADRHGLRPPEREVTRFHPERDGPPALTGACRKALEAAGRPPRVHGPGRVRGDRMRRFPDDR
jgi:hypothetical protein